MPTGGPRRGRRGLAVAGLLVVLALVAGAATYGWGEVRRGLDRAGRAVGVPLVPATPDRSSSVPAAAAKVVVRGGDPDDPTQQVVAAALADVDAFWRTAYAEVDDAPYRTVAGGFYAYGDGSTPPCASNAAEVAGNAFYCPEADVIAWDGVRLMPRLREDYGDLGVGLVVAHEWGHAMQLRAGDTGPTIFMEQQADCYAGAWVADARTRDGAFEVDDAALDLAMAGFLELRDRPGQSAADPRAHGTAFDRIRAFQEGVDGGVGTCAAYEARSLPLVGIEFRSYDELATGGNLPLDEAVELTSADLADHWAGAWSELGAGGSFAAPELDLADRLPRCRDAVDVPGGVRWCPSSGALTVRSEVASRAADGIGDFAVSTLLGAGWSAAALAQADALPDGDAARVRAVDCLTGAWTRSVFDGDREGASLSLSPGDLDEAVGTLLATRSTDDPGATGTGFDRVTAYRQGFVEGAAACRR